MLSSLNRSFFAGPSALWQLTGHRERRKSYRRFTAILKVGDTEPCELFTAVSMLHGAALLLLADGERVLPLALLVGVALLLCGTLGIIGLATRALWVRALFAFSGLFVRLYMSLTYFASEWHDPAWIPYFFSAVMLGWIGVRITCEEFSRRARKNHAEQSEAVQLNEKGECAGLNLPPRFDG